MVRCDKFKFYEWLKIGTLLSKTTKNKIWHLTQNPKLSNFLPKWIKLLSSKKNNLVSTQEDVNLVAIFNAAVMYLSTVSLRLCNTLFHFPNFLFCTSWFNPLSFFALTHFKPDSFLSWSMSKLAHPFLKLGPGIFLGRGMLKVTFQLGDSSIFRKVARCGILWCTKQSLGLFSTLNLQNRTVRKF